MAELAHVWLRSLSRGLSSDIVPHQLSQLLDLKLVNAIFFLFLLQNQQLLLLFQLLLFIVQVYCSYFLLPCPLHLLLLLLDTLNLRLQVP